MLIGIKCLVSNHISVVSQQKTLYSIDNIELQIVSELCSECVFFARNRTTSFTDQAGYCTHFKPQHLPDLLHNVTLLMLCLSWLCYKFESWFYKYM